MNLVYRCTWIESEAGWGQRPDGVTYAMSEAKLTAEIVRQESMGTYECYSRASGIGQCLVNDELFDLVQERGIVNTARNDHEGFLGVFIPKK
jgi:hypothetical protein